MAAKVSSLTGELVLDINKWSAPIKAAQRDVGALEKSMSPLAGVASAVGGALVGMATAAAAALATAVKVSADYGDKIRDASVRTGLTTEALSGLKLQAEQSGTSFDALNTGLQRLSRTFGEAAATGKGQAAEAFNQVGISVKELRAANGNLEPILRKVMDRMAELPTASQRAAVGTALMGKGFNELQEVMASGSLGMDAFRAKADLFGITVGKDAANAADNFNDALNNLKQASLGLTLQIGQKLIPAITEFINWTTAAGVTLKDFIVGIDSAGTSLGAYANFALELGVGTLEKMIPGFVGLTDKIRENKTAIEASTESEKKRNIELDKGKRTLAEKTEAEKKYADLLKRGTDEVQRLQKTQLDKELRDYQQGMADREKANEHAFKVALDNMEAERNKQLGIINAVDKARAESAKLAQEAEEKLQGQLKESFDANEDYAVSKMKGLEEATQGALAQINEVNKGAERTSKEAAERTARVWETAAGNITSDFAHALSDIIFEGRKFGDAMSGIAKSTAKSMFDAFLGGLLTPLTSKLAGIGSDLADAIFGGGGGAAGGGGKSSLIGGAAGILGGLFKGGGNNAFGDPNAGVWGPGGGGGSGIGGLLGMGGGGGQLTGLAAKLNPLGMGLGIANSAVDLWGKTFGKIGDGRNAANEIVKLQDSLVASVGQTLSDSSLSAINKSKIVENLFSGFGSSNAAFIGSGGSNAKAGNQATATLLPWMTNVRAGLARDIDAAGGEASGGGGGAQTVNNYSFVINLSEGKNARATGALIRDEIIPAIVDAMKANTGGLTAATTIAVKGSLQGAVATA